MTKNLGRDYVYGYESAKPAEKPPLTVFGLSVGALIPLGGMIVALLVGRTFFGL